MDNPILPQPVPARNPRRRYPLITGTGFANPSTDWDAYWIGFIAADGGIHGNLVRLRLAARDVDHLYTFRAGMQLENPVRVAPNGGYPAAQRPGTTVPRRFSVRAHARVLAGLLRRQWYDHVAGAARADGEWLARGGTPL